MHLHRSEKQLTDFTVSPVVAQLRRSGNLTLQVMKNPVKFAGNLINALKGGFRNFFSNASKHLQNGLGQWPSGAGGMVLPAKLDVQGLLMTALIVTGLTYQAMRGRLIAQLGPGGAKKVQQAEGVGGALQTMKGGLHTADEMKDREGCGERHDWDGKSQSRGEDHAATGQAIGCPHRHRDPC